MLNFSYKEKNVSDKIIGEIRTHILWSTAYSRRYCHLWGNVGRYCTVRQQVTIHEFGAENKQECRYT